jgi:hypothetical protein
VSGQGISPHEHLLLHLFGDLVEQAWGEKGYLVGSSQRERPEGVQPRDIDVRVMLSDEHWDRWFPAIEYAYRYVDATWRAHMLAWSALGSGMCGLRVDFQVERLEDANQKHDGRRNPLGEWRRHYSRAVPQ